MSNEADKSAAETVVQSETAEPGEELSLEQLEAVSGGAAAPPPPKPKPTGTTGGTYSSQTSLPADRLGADEGQPSTRGGCDVLIVTAARVERTSPPFEPAWSDLGARSSSRGSASDAACAMWSHPTTWRALRLAGRSGFYVRSSV